MIDCIESGWISSEGPYVKKFEEAFAAKLGRKYAISVCNGSVALDAAMLALDLEKGNEVIMPTFTIISCAAAIIRAGCIPVVVDCDPETFNIDVALIERKITPKTKAIMVVHIYGLPVDMKPIFELAEKFQLKIIEDAAEQHGQFYNQAPIGTLGDISTFSFYPNKHITTGEGGMIVTDDEHLANRCRSLRNLCFVPEKRFIHYELGYNFRMSNLQAAIGLAQLEQLDEFVERKRAMGTYYTAGLSNLKSLQLPMVQQPFAKNIYWVYAVVLSDEIDVVADDIIKRLKDVGIDTRPFFYPMHLQPVFKKMGLFKNESHIVSERIAKKGFYLPSGLGLSTSQQDEVIEKLTTILQQ